MIKILRTRLALVASLVAGLVAALLLLAGCSRPVPVPLIFGPAVWADGEESIYTVTDRDGQPAGNATYRFAATTDSAGDPAWQLYRQVDSLGDQEVVTMTVEAQGFRPLASQLRRAYPGGGTEMVDAVFTSGTVDMTLTTRQNIMTTQRTQVPSDARETVALPMLARSLPLAQGYATQINSFLPIAALLDRVTLAVTGEENVTVPYGTFAAWAVELDSGDAVTRLWIGKEAPYPLLKYQDGRNRAVLELAQFTPGQ